MSNRRYSDRSEQRHWMTHLLASITGDDGFPHESLFQIRVEVVQP